jgi:putative DNA primase/helicase
MTDYVGAALGEAQSGDAKLISQCAANILPRRIEFIWSGRIARGKHTAIAGEPGDGKSQLSIYVAATISVGGEWPCGEGRAPIGNVIILNAEDGADDTVVPRLIAVGADLSRVHIVSSVLQGDGKGHRSFNLQADLALLEQKIAEVGNVALVIIDPISSYMGKIDSHRNTEVRGALEPASEMAERLKVAILSVTHFSKSGGNTGKALHRFIGSIAFVGAPRAAFAVIEDADNEGRILFLHAKNNMAAKPQGLAYRLVQTIVGDREGIVASYVAWDNEPVSVSADEALRANEGGGDKTAKADAMEFLRAALADGPVPAAEINRMARDHGLTTKAIRSGREALGVKIERDGFGPGSKSLWSLPKTSILAQSPILAQQKEWASMESEGKYGGPADPLGGEILPNFSPERAESPRTPSATDVLPNLSPELPTRSVPTPEPQKVSKAAADDWPELPACLRRTPAKPAVLRPNPPALGPPGDSLDDFK